MLVDTIIGMRTKAAKLDGKDGSISGVGGGRDNIESLMKQ